MRFSMKGKSVFDLAAALSELPPDQIPSALDIDRWTALEVSRTLRAQRRSLLWWHVRYCAALCVDTLWPRRAPAVTGKPRYRPHEGKSPISDATFTTAHGLAPDEPVRLKD